MYEMHFTFQWTVFEQPLNISAAQLEQFRSLLTHDGEPLGSRQITTLRIIIRLMHYLLFSEQLPPDPACEWQEGEPGADGQPALVLSLQPILSFQVTQLNLGKDSL